MFVFYIRVTRTSINLIVVGLLESEGSNHNQREHGNDKKFVTVPLNCFIYSVEYCFCHDVRISNFNLFLRNIDVLFSLQENNLFFLRFSGHLKKYLHIR
jgi:hypothetical protein